jgi:PAS domain-containing protein
MCPACATHFGRLWGGMSIGEYLEGLAGPVLVLDGDARVLGANRAASERLGRDLSAAAGLLAGEAMACSHSRLPGGCGRTVHCRECAIRNTVARVSRTGRAERGVPAWLTTATGRVALVIGARPRDGLVEVTVEEVRPPGREAP